MSKIIYYPIPIHRQPAYAHLGFKQGSLPVTEQLCSEVLRLPIFRELKDEQQQVVIDTLRQLITTQSTIAGFKTMQSKLKPAKDDLAA